MEKILEVSGLSWSSKQNTTKLMRVTKNLNGDFVYFGQIWRPLPDCNSMKLVGDIFCCCSISPNDN